jgi:hypothetical protein
MPLRIFFAICRPFHRLTTIFATKISEIDVKKRKTLPLAFGEDGRAKYFKESV